MKTLLIMVLALGLIPAFAFAESTSNATWKSNGYEDCVEGEEVNEFLNETGVLNHTHNYDKYDRDNPVGIGIDAKVFDFDNKVLKSLNVEAKRDFENSETSIFGIWHLDLSALWPKK